MKNTEITVTYIRLKSLKVIFEKVNGRYTSSLEKFRTKKFHILLLLLLWM